MKKLYFMISVALILLLVPVASAENATNVTYEELQEMGAFDSINNLNNATIEPLNISDYQLSKMLTCDDSKNTYENLETMIGAPITYGGSAEFAGSWFYAFLFIVPLIFVYGKSKSVEVTSMVMLMMSGTIIVSSMTDVTDLPASFLTFVSLVGLLGFIGVLYSFIGDD